MGRRAGNAALQEHDEVEADGYFATRLEYRRPAINWLQDFTSTFV
jgi:hypothetical protein